MKNVAILISGRGSNMVALLDAMAAGEVPARCVLVLSNREDAPGLEYARLKSIPTQVVDHKASATREEHDGKLVAALRAAETDIVCLAGYMRLLSPVFIQAFRGRILNIHPALLPAFPGLHVQQKALDAGVRFSGCTVHIVDEEMDHGPIVMQAVVPVMPGDDEERLSARILDYEHRLYPVALRLLAEDRVTLEGLRARLDLDTEAFTAIVQRLTWREEPHVQ